MLGVLHHAARRVRLQGSDVAPLEGKPSEDDDREPLMADDRELENLQQRGAALEAKKGL